MLKLILSIHDKIGNKFLVSPLVFQKKSVYIKIINHIKKILMIMNGVNDYKFLYITLQY